MDWTDVIVLLAIIGTIFFITGIFYTLYYPEVVSCIVFERFC
jgi:hypothetical protein